MRGRFAALSVVVFVVGCGGSQGVSEEQERATRELQRAEDQLREERQRLERESRKLERQQHDSAEKSPSGSGEDRGDSTTERGRVPNVRGKDHQLAQDTLQAAGFYNLSEEDATGQDRPLLFDRNWVVVSQSPKAGTRASLDRTIILRSKKKGE